MIISKKHIFPILFFVALFVSQCKKDDINETNSKITPNDFLSDKKYDQLIIEIQYVEGFQPTSAALDNLKAFLEQRLNKSKGITIKQYSISSPGKASYTLSDIKEIEKNNRINYSKDKTLTAYFLFADADYGENSGSSKVLGVAYGPTSMAVFEKTIREFSGGIGKPSNTSLETTVANHEFAHILGLVNNGTDLQSDHQDINHGKHCNNSDCLMYYTAETSDIIANILGSGIPVLDSKCISDLQANGGK
ncbi:MAG: peptidase [Bacteroidota bacterium]|nr:peptidase [Bacteroidota bacterium]